MTVFDANARRYDLLCRDKDDAGGARFVLERLEAHGPYPESLLNLGLRAVHEDEQAGMHMRGYKPAVDELRRAVDTALARTGSREAFEEQSASPGRTAGA